MVVLYPLTLRIPARYLRDGARKLLWEKGSGAPLFHGAVYVSQFRICFSLSLLSCQVRPCSHPLPLGFVCSLSVG